MDNGCSILTVGLGWGDECKGSYNQYLSKETDILLHERYNGGCQGRHCIMHNGREMVFSHLSTGMVYPESITIMSKNFVIEPFALYNEVCCISRILDIPVTEFIHRIFIDSKCICATPIHKLYNMAEEETGNVRGSVGTGISIAGFYSKENQDTMLTADNLLDRDTTENILVKQKKYFSMLCNEKGYVCNLSDFDVAKCADELCMIMKHFKDCIVDTYQRFHSDGGNRFLYESSQGILLDKHYGFPPNTTLLDVSTDSVADAEAKIGIIRSVYTRHGRGIFPTESCYLNSILSDRSQECGKYSGRIRFGYFDCIMYRYALKLSGVKEVFVSCMDYLTNMNKIKICTGYIYQGNTDADELSQYFNCANDGGNIYIYDIVKTGPDISYFLNDCIPQYAELAFSCADIFTKANAYASFLEKQGGIKITNFSLGTEINDRYIR